MNRGVYVAKDMGRGVGADVEKRDAAQYAHQKARIDEIDRDK